ASSNPLSSIKSNLITQMVQELRTPLTSILGMASVLNREIYGPLTDKQKEYMDIVHNSGQYLLSILTEILELGALDDSNCALNLIPVDIEMLCQQAIATLQQAAQRREQQIRLTVEPGHRIWVLDKDKVRQMLYHLVFSVIQASSTDSTIRIHVSRKQNRLHLTVWTSHPWLGEGLPQSEIHASQLLQSDHPETDLIRLNRNSSIDLEMLKMAQRAANAEESAPDSEDKPKVSSRHNLGLMLSRQLVELHGGRIGIQGSAETGYRYVVSIPQITDASDMEP
ncbi:MAG TPA: HAMP domain-containing sensor histidine kinase, partial [Allocoleopsis sp.]